MSAFACGYLLHAGKLLKHPQENHVSSLNEANLNIFTTPLHKLLSGLVVSSYNLS